MGDYIFKTLGITVNRFGEIGQSDEVKQDHDGITKHFVYINFLYEYESGQLKDMKGVERIEWIPREKLSEYDIVPPSVKLFKEIGYLK